LIHIIPSWTISVNLSEAKHLLSLIESKQKADPSCRLQQGFQTEIGTSLPLRMTSSAVLQQPLVRYGRKNVNFAFVWHRPADRHPFTTKAQRHQDIRGQFGGFRPLSVLR